MGPIPFNRPSLVGNEKAYMTEAVARGWISGDGDFSRRVHELLERELGVHRALLTTSCTHALEMSALLLDIGPGDEVIVPSFTFVSTANAFALRGARPVFSDVRADTLNLDESRLESLITGKTRAIVPVHYAGVGCEMETISAIAEKHKVPVVEDNAHGIFGKYRGRYLGTFGALATLSFHETKSFFCGEGGALLINDPALIRRAEILREKGTNRAEFFLGHVDKYTWVDLGSSYLPSDLLAAFLLAQLEAKEKVLRARKAVFDRYAAALAGWAEREGVRLPVVPDDCEQSYHMFYLLLPTAQARGRFLADLRRRSIQAVFHYVPLHLSPMGRGFGGELGDCPVTEDVSEKLVRLPFFNDLSAPEIERIIEAILEFRA